MKFRLAILQPGHRGAALILALIFIGAIGVLTLSALALSRHEVQVASVNADDSRIEIALTAGFEDAKNLLLNGVSGDSDPQSFRGDDYLVTAVREKGKTPAESARYTYILRPEGSSYRAIPLFAGGKEESFAMNTGADPFLQPPMRPTVAWESGSAPEELLELPPLTDLLPSGPVKEYRRPKTAWKEVDTDPAPSATRTERYTYWIEDLQGYPDLASVGNPGLDSGDEATFLGARRSAIRWGGYGRYDGRLPKSNQTTIPMDRMHCLAPDDYQLYYPEVLVVRGDGWKSYQAIAGQVAPGLSPRELHVFPWVDSTWGSRPIFEHPYWRAANIRANQEGIASTGSLASLAPFEPEAATRRQFDWNIEERFSMGLSGYREVPLVPAGFGYAQESKPRRNLNAWMARVEAATGSQKEIVRKEVTDEIAQYMRQVLPLFGQRKGGFPEDYFRTLAASIIDYADTDSMPTVQSPNGWTWASTIVPYAPAHDASAYRGIDSYPLANEFFLKFSYDGYEANKVFFKATPFVELWNPTNAPVDYAGLQVNFRFLEDFTVKVGSDQRRNITNRSPAGPVALHANSSGSGSTILKPNEFRVVRFQDYDFDAVFVADDDDVGVPIIEELRAATKQNAEANYELVLNGVRIDGSGRMGYHCGKAGYPPDTEEGVHGFEVTNHPNAEFSRDFSGKASQMRQGDFVIRFWATAMRSRHSFESTCYGDPRMAYYARGQYYPLCYVTSATPGSRNRNRSAPAGRDGYSDVVRAWAWPDGGYDSAIPSTFNLRPGPQLPPLDPDVAAANAAAPVDSGMAPWRISNQGRYYSTTELGNIYDPVMWRPQFVNPTNGTFSATPPQSGKLVSSNLLAADYATMDANVLSMAPAARKSIDAQLGDRKFGAQEFGGGNSLRVGRLEHPRFDVMGQRASQLLDFFHTGTPGTNCDFYTDSEATELVNDAARYQHFMREANSPPPSAPDAVRAKEAPYRDVYPEDLHAASLYRWVSGQLNINSVATQFEMESLLRGCFASSDITWNRATTKSAAERPATFVSLGGLVEADSGKYETPSVLDHGLNTDAADKDLRGPSARPRKTVSDVARKLMLARPFRGPSHLAAAVAQAVGSSDRETALLGDGANSGEGKASALPEWASDAVQEEPFARILNSTTLSSRHFRIYVRGESVVRRPAALNGVLEENIEQVSGRALKVYDVFLQPSRNQGGKIVATQIQILNVRSL